MLRNRLPVKQAALVGAVALSMVLAGCVDFFSAEAAPHGFASFAEALAAGGDAVEPEDNDSTVRVKLLDPKADMFPVGQDVTIWLLVYDSSGPTPIRDASIRLSAHMPAQDGTEEHDASHIVDPEHDSYGIYSGETHLDTAGQWELQLTVVALDAGLTFIIPVQTTAADDIDPVDTGNDTTEPDDTDNGSTDDGTNDDTGDDGSNDDDPLGNGTIEDNVTGNETGNGTGNGTTVTDPGQLEGSWSQNVVLAQATNTYRWNFTLNATASLINVTLALKPYKTAADAPATVIAEALVISLRAPDDTILDNATTGPGVYVFPADTGQGVARNLSFEVPNPGQTGLYWIEVNVTGVGVAWDSTWKVTL